APPDWLLFVREGGLRAQRLDLKSLTLVGDSLPVAESVQASGSLNFANVSASSTAVLTYVTGSSATGSTLSVVDKSGKPLGAIGSENEQLDVSIAPDGHAVSVSRYTTSGTSDIWVCDTRRNLETRQTFSPANELGAVWSPDSKTIVFTSFDKRPG